MRQQRVIDDGDEAPDEEQTGQQSQRWSVADRGRYGGSVNVSRWVRHGSPFDVFCRRHYLWCALLSEYILRLRGCAQGFHCSNPDIQLLEKRLASFAPGLACTPRAWMESVLRTPRGGGIVWPNIHMRSVSSRL